MSRQAATENLAPLPQSWRVKACALILAATLGLMLLLCSTATDMHSEMDAEMALVACAMVAILAAPLAKPAAVALRSLLRIVGLLGRKLEPAQRLRLNAIFISIFLVVAHVAMIFGMLDPALLQASTTANPPPMDM